MQTWFKSGSPWIWMTAGAVSISLLSVIGLLILIASKGLSYFWPAPIHQMHIVDELGKERTIIGEIYEREWVPTQRLVEAGITFATPQSEQVERLLIKTGNREFVELDFQWLLQPFVIEDTMPSDLAVFERSKNGNFYGYIQAVVKQGEIITKDKEQVLHDLLDRVLALNDAALDLQNQDIGSINYQLEKLRLRQKQHQIDGEWTAELKQQLSAEKAQLLTQYKTLEKRLFDYRTQAARDAVLIKDMRGETVELPLSQILSVTMPNRMSFTDKLAQFGYQLGKFIIDDPREANTEG